MPMLLIHPNTGDVYSIRRGEEHAAKVFEDLVLDGYRPIGPNGKALADKILAAPATPPAV